MADNILTRDAILQVDDLGRAEVDVPEWGGKVLVRGMTASERDEIESMLLDFQNGVPRLKPQGTTAVRATVVAMCTIAPDGTPLFTRKDVDLLARKSARALDRIFQEVMRLSGMSDTAVEVAKGN